MGMTYKFQVAKKGSVPEEQDYYDETGWTDVGGELDREDWINGFIRNGPGREVRAVKVDGHDYIVDGREKFTHLRSCWCFTNAVDTTRGGAK